MINYSIQPVFPSALLHANIGRELLKEEIDYAQHLSGFVNESDGNFQSTNHYVLNEPPFADLKQFIEAGLDTYVKTVMIPEEDVQLYITQSWLNYTEPNKFHHLHTHPNSLISGVFYFNAIKGKDAIMFERKEYERIYYVPKKPNIFNAKNIHVDVVTGDLLLFPSEIPHSVPKTKSDEVRVSLAFNTFVKGGFGTEDSLTRVVI